MNKWTKIKLQQVAGDKKTKSRWKCENPTCPGKGGGLEAHHALFSRSRNHKEYDALWNMIMLCHRCNVQRLFDNKEGKLLSLDILVGLHGKEYMIDSLAALKDTHKMHDEINYYLRVLED